MASKEIVINKRLSLPVGHHFLLFLLFLGLKLAGAIDWAWIWVLLPLIAKAALVGAFLTLKIFEYGTEEDDETDGMDL